MLNVTTAIEAAIFSLIRCDVIYLDVASYHLNRRHRLSLSMTSPRSFYLSLKFYLFAGEKAFERKKKRHWEKKICSFEVFHAMVYWRRVGVGWVSQ